MDDLIGKRIEVIDPIDNNLYPIGSVGTIVAKVENRNIYGVKGGEMWYVKFDNDQPKVDYCGNWEYTNQTGENCCGVWILEEEEFKIIDDTEIGYIETGKIKKRKEEWKPDELKEDIDVLKVTAELVSVEVGK